MDNKERSIKDLNSEEVLSAINENLYLKKIEDLQERINRINPDKTNDEKTRTLTRNDQKELEKLDKQIKANRKILEAFQQTVNSLNILAHKMEEISKEYALQKSFEEALERFVYANSDNKKSIREDLKARIGKKLRKSGLTYQKDVRKISKEVYNLLKSANKKFQLDISSLNLNDHTEITSIKNFVEKASYNIESLMKSFFDEKVPEYSVSYAEGARNSGANSLQVEAKKLQDAANNEFNITDEGKDAISRLERIANVRKKSLAHNIDYGDLEKITEMYNDVVSLSRDVAGLNIVLEAFKNTEFAKTEIYQITVEFRNEQMKKLQDIYTKAENFYDSLALAKKGNEIGGLDDLIREIKRLDYMIDKLGYTNNQKELFELNELKNKAIREIEKYMENHPEINPNYLAAHGIYLGDKKLTSVPEQVTPNNFVSKSAPEQVIPNNEDIVAPTVVSPENEFNKDQENMYLSEKLASTRSVYYQDYIKFININKSIYLTFVEYLKRINNGNLDKLIGLEVNKNEVLELMYEEFRQMYPQDKWNDKELFKFFCQNRSKLREKVVGDYAYISELDIEDFIENMIKQNTLDYNPEEKTV